MTQEAKQDQEAQDQEPRLGTVQRSIRRHPLIFTLVFIAVGIAVVGYLWNPPIPKHWKDRGEIGDAVAPITALLTALALFWSIHSIGMQREELRRQRVELRAQREERKASREALQEQAAAQKQQVQAQQRMERAYLLLANTTQLGHLLAYWQKYVDAEQGNTKSARTHARGLPMTQQRHGEIMARLHRLDKETEAALAALATASTEPETEGDAD